VSDSRLDKWSISIGLSEITCLHVELKWETGEYVYWQDDTPFQLFCQTILQIPTSFLLYHPPIHILTKILIDK